MQPSADAWLVFWYRVENPAFPQDLTVSIGDAPIFQVTGSTSEDYLEVNVPLANYTGQTVSIIFTGGTGAGGTDPGICLDDVSVKLEYRWTGSSDADWNNTGNWNISQVPDSDGIVVIPGNPSSGRFPEINNAFVAECYRLALEQNASILVKNGGELNVLNP